MIDLSMKVKKAICKDVKRGWWTFRVGGAYLTSKLNEQGEVGWDGEKKNDFYSQSPTNSSSSLTGVSAFTLSP